LVTCYNHCPSIQKL